MSRKCDKLRRQALLSGLDSARGASWRAHAKRCESCRRELALLDLGREESVKRHLDRQRVEGLLDAVEQQGRRNRRRGPLRFALQLAAVVVFLWSIAFLYDVAGALGREAGSGTALSVHGTLDRIAAEVLAPGEAVGTVFDFTRAFADETSPKESETPIGADAIEQDLARIRRSLDRHRQHMIGLCSPEQDGYYWARFGAPQRSRATSQSHH